MKLGDQCYVQYVRNTKDIRNAILRFMRLGMSSLQSGDKEYYRPLTQEIRNTILTFKRLGIPHVQEIRNNTVLGLKRLGTLSLHSRG
jgi:hypothetical protein